MQRYDTTCIYFNQKHVADPLTCQFCLIFTYLILAIRLVSGDSRSGRLEVNFLGDWGTVCEESFGVNEAKVVCRVLGFNT